jgi:glycosyltransferase involved in cell wall biosynthesis
MGLFHLLGSRKFSHEPTLRIGIDAHMLGQHETGNETYIFELVKALLEIDHKNEYFLFVEEPSGLPKIAINAPNCLIVQLKSHSPLIRLGYELSYWAKHYYLDILHVTYNAPLFQTCPTIVTIHDIAFEMFPEWFSVRDKIILKTLVPRSARKASRVLTISDAARSDIIARYKLANELVTTIHIAPGIDFLHIDPHQIDTIRQKYKTSDRFILAVGNLQPRKNLQRLIQAFAKAKRSDQIPHKLVIVGQNWYQAHQIYDSVKEMNIEADIVFTGYIPKEDLRGLYAAANAFVYPSLYEGFGLPIVEAMACGTPVITSNIPVLTEVAADAAYFVDPKDTDSICAALLTVLSSTELQHQLSEKGLARAQHFSWRECAYQTLKTYLQVSEQANS